MDQTLEVPEYLYLVLPSTRQLIEDGANRERIIAKSSKPRQSAMWLLKLTGIAYF